MLSLVCAMVLLIEPDAGLQTVVRAERLHRDGTPRVRLQGVEAHEVPGAGGDPFRAVMALPGVTALFSGLPNAVVRGSSPSSTAYFLDDIRVPQLFHAFLGPAVISPELIKSVDFLPGGASVERGRLLGGAVEAQLTTPRELMAQASIDLLSAGAVAETTFHYTGTSVMVAGRYSYNEGLFSLLGKLRGARTRNIADFWDYQGRVVQKLWGGELRLFGFGSFDNSGSVAVTAEAATTTQLVIFHRLDARYRHQLGSGTVDVGLTAGEDEIGAHSIQQQVVTSHDGSTKAGLIDEQSHIGQTTIAGRLKWQGTLSDTWSLSAGATAERVRARWRQQYAYHFDSVGSAGTRLEPPAMGAWFGGWVETNWSGLPRTVITTGVRADQFRRFGGRSLAAMDPRVSARVTLSDRLSLRASAGSYHQSPSFLMALPVVDLTASDYGFQHSLQCSVGATWHLWRALELTIDAYANPMTRLAEYQLFDDERPFAPNPFTAGSVAPADVGTPLISSGISYGVDLLLRWRLREHFFGWVTVSVQRSTRRQSYRLTDGRQFTGTATGELPFAYDQTLVTNAVLGYRFESRWAVGLSAHFNTGRPESGQYGSRTNVASNDERTWLMLPRNQVARLPPFFRVDVRVTKVWQIGRVAIEASLDVLNASIQTEVQNYWYTGGNGAPLAKVILDEPLFIPTARLKATFE